LKWAYRIDYVVVAEGFLDFAFAENGTQFGRDSQRK